MTIHNPVFKMTPATVGRAGTSLCTSNTHRRTTLEVDRHGVPVRRYRAGHARGSGDPLRPRDGQGLQALRGLTVTVACRSPGSRRPVDGQLFRLRAGLCRGDHRRRAVMRGNSRSRQ